ncbi:histidine kinase [Duganella sacchari]|uniref:histidine kinase n=1 Tax=Duganella sacchari TaxID=551987 RepID=A0A1M7R7C2_9BURK|nr:HAMP domain-containing sensor histidine kinase [Duganella sacchari]SHN42051.1 histidine kinase [Duganella sacchari]
MMYEFLTNNRGELTQRCRDKVAMRPGRSASSIQLENGVPIFLDQLIRTLETEQTQNPGASHRISGPAGGASVSSEVGTSATQHGKDLLEMGFSVDEVVHDYGDLCQAITDLAVERDAPFQIDEFRTLNRCLDNAIADAVNEFSYQKELAVTKKIANETNQRAGFFAHELRNILGTATLAFSAAKTGNLSLHGATGTILERSLDGLAKLIDESIAEVRMLSHNTLASTSFSLSEFVAELKAAAELAAKAKGCLLSVPSIDPLLAIIGNRELLFSAVANLLQNAIKFTHPGTEVRLCAYAVADRIQIDVADHCGGLPPNAEETMFLPFAQNGADRNGLGLGLTIAQQSVKACNGTLEVHNLPTVGCVFTISLPRFEVPT